MKKDYGVKVRLTKEGCCGHIVRRLNAAAYEIVTEDERVLILEPEEFEEIKKETKDDR